jgi:hypothetical protein
VNYIIIGTDHTLQKSDSPNTGLRDLLRSIVDTYPVVLIAEEVKTSEDVHTFGRELIGESRWLSIDMKIQEREDEGLYDIPCEEGPGYDHITHRDIPLVNRYHTKREAIRETSWLAKIARWCEDRELSAGTVVVTCGHNHMRAGFLSGKVLQRGHTVETREYLSFDIEARYGVFTICP